MRLFTLEKGNRRVVLAPEQNLVSVLLDGRPTLTRLANGWRYMETCISLGYKVVSEKG